MPTLARLEVEGGGGVLPPTAGVVDENEPPPSSTPSPKAKADAKANAGRGDEGARRVTASPGATLRELKAAANRRSDDDHFDADDDGGGDEAGVESRGECDGEGRAGAPRSGAAAPAAAARPAVVTARKSKRDNASAAKAGATDPPSGSAAAREGTAAGEEGGGRSPEGRSPGASADRSSEGGRCAHPSKRPSSSEKEEEEEEEGASSAMRKKRPIYDLLSSSSEEDGDEEEEPERPAAQKRRRAANEPPSRAPRARRGASSDDGWTTSFRAEDSRPSGPSSSDDDDDSSSDEDDVLRDLSSYNWLTSSSRRSKLRFLEEKVDNDPDRALQMLLWDLQFGYDLKAHQFEAVRFVAGYCDRFPFAARGKKGQAKGGTKAPDAEASGSDDDSDSSSDSSSDQDSDAEGRGGSEAEEDDEREEEEDLADDLLRPDEVGRAARTRALDRKELLLSGKRRGMILADEMGLGKTIESLAGAILRDARKTPGRKRLPTLIVAPQDGVQAQWVESLKVAGVDASRIATSVKADARRRASGKGGRGGRRLDHGRRSAQFVVCTRYKIQTEMRRLFDYSKTKELQANQKRSLLFSDVPTALVKKLRHEYNVDKGKESSFAHGRGSDSKEDRVTRLIRESLGAKNGLGHVFETVIIDEAHFLRNVLAYWGMGAALLGAQAKRIALLSGTPYNNSHKDMSALMTYIDPRSPASRVKWWERATARKNRRDVVSAVSDWRKAYMLRRTKDVIQLPPRTTTLAGVPMNPSELGIYEHYESVFLLVLNQYQEDDFGDRRKELLEIMMACMACMRMALIHPLLPGGREATMCFSPSRRHLLNREEKKDKCVFCCDHYPSQKAREFDAKMADKVKEEVGESVYQDLLQLAEGTRLDDDIMEELDEELSINVRTGKRDDEKGPIVELGSDYCRAAGSECRHFGHESCIENVKAEGGDLFCPRCLDLESRTTTGGSKRETYCGRIGTHYSSSKGFTTSAKIDKIIEWIQMVPKSDKAIIMSFFKGILDLVEGIMVEDLGIECARYDGDIAKEKRALDLKRFQKEGTCRFLLASVPSGGTGLNITEANHICFIDRWFNPQIHDQAESRCHRIHQTKEVKITYLDTHFTADVVLREVNARKKQNADVLLADGTSIGQQTNSVFSDLSGIIGDGLKIQRAIRHGLLAANGITGAPLLAGESPDLENQLFEEATARATLKRTVANKGKGSSDDEDSQDESFSSSQDVKSLLKLGRKIYYSPLSSSDGSVASCDSAMLNESIFHRKIEQTQSQAEAKDSSVASAKEHPGCPEAKHSPEGRPSSRPSARNDSCISCENEIIEIFSSDEEDEDYHHDKATAIKNSFQN